MVVFFVFVGVLVIDSFRIEGFVSDVATLLGILLPFLVIIIYILGVFFKFLNAVLPEASTFMSVCPFVRLRLLAIRYPELTVHHPFFIFI